MRNSILKILKCPLCRAEGTFAAGAARSNEREIREGQIACTACHQVFGIHSGVIDLLPPGKIREEVAREIAGWEENVRSWFDLSGEGDNFWLVRPDNNETVGISSDEYLRRLPHFDRIAKHLHEQEGYKLDSFNELMEMVVLKQGDRLLELGAARCWTLRHFSRLGCCCVATDIVTTKYLGLESSDVYFEEDPRLYWERVRCDMEEIPFGENSFDYVFCNAVLHHSKQVSKVVGEIWRVLAPGGSLLIVNEPDYGLLDRRKSKLAQDHEAATTGANENLYNQRYLVRLLRRVGFRTNFLPHRWLVKYYAWRLYQYYERFTNRKDSTVQDRIEKTLLAHEKLLRWLVAMGTIGTAQKPA